MPTTNKGLNQPALGSPSWGTPLNDNATILDNALGAYQVVTGTSGTVNLNTVQVQSMCLKSDTVAFTGNVTFVIPNGVAGQWIVVNQSASNSFELRVKNAASGTYVSIGNGETRTVYSDGTKVFFTDIQTVVQPQSINLGGNFTTTGANCTNTDATVTFAESYLIDVGQVIQITGVTPAGYNGVWTVTASAPGSVTFGVPSTLGSQTVAGTLYYGAITASTLNLSGRGQLVGAATQTEATTGTNNTTLMTPLRVAQAIDAQVLPSVILIGTLTTTSGTSRTISGLDLTTYTFLYLVFRNVSVNQAAARSITIGSGLFATSSSTSEAGSIIGIATIALNNGTYVSNYLSSGTAAIVGTCGITTANTSITVSVSSGASFDAGSILFYGVK